MELIGIRCFTTVYELSEDVQKSLEIYPYFLLTSAFFLVITFAVYVIIPEIRNNIHGMAMMSYFGVLAAFYIGLALIKLGVGLGPDRENEFDAYCKPLGMFSLTRQSVHTISFNKDLRQQLELICCS